ncbi:MAG: tagatose-6-phosphate ketose isomerase [Tractidigestivibacter sp.]|jgi:tagatose-6-phosphate ketose/aldose isomerase|uniref:SIS domain-containing protein n=1 Tax=Tractidigestivibacter sp. TaxID=2847320 RepID=UPI003D8A106E
MFEMDTDALTKLGAQITTAEIKQQPGLWRGALKIYEENLPAINDFLAKARELGGSRRTRVIFCGAGTSAYVSDTVVPYLRRVGDRDSFEFAAVATTDIVCSPLDYVSPEDPTVMVSFARSGNSPESVASVERVGQVAKDLLYLNITCAPEGKLAQDSKGDPRALTILIPDANDKGFAMTGSYSCMELMAALIFDPATLEQKRAWVEQAASMGEDVVAREDQIKGWVDRDFNRVTYLGSASLSGLARESQLKILELCAGKIATSFDSSMGYRHGPKSFVDPKTLVFVYVNNDPYTRQYDLDILNEIAGDKIALATVAIQQKNGSDFTGESFSFEGGAPLPDAYVALPFVMVAQTVALNSSVKVGNTPDTPSPTGTVNRVVKGVTIHPFEN